MLPRSEWPRSCVSHRHLRGTHTKTSSALAASLLDTIRTRHVRAGVIGLGYVGLPLAVEFARAGYTTTGVDLDVAKVDAINEGRSYIDDVPTDIVADLRARGRLRASANFDVVAELDTVNV